MTGRRTINFADHDLMSHMGAQSFKEAKAEVGVSTDPFLDARLQHVVDRLAPVVAADIPGVMFDPVVLDEPLRYNAFSTPEGHIAINSGLLAALNDDQLAWVIAHEMAHLVARHADERFSRQVLAAGGSASAVLVGGAGGAAAAQSSGNAFSGLSWITGLRFNREQELEADRMGLIYMARAGYNPEEAKAVFKILDEERKAIGARTPIGIFSTHPPSPEREKQVEYRMPEAVDEYMRVGGTPTVGK